MKIVTQEFPYPDDLDVAVRELRYFPGWRFKLKDHDRGQGCRGLTLLIYPDHPDMYNPDRHVNTVFTYPVPAASFNRESWEEWLWDRIRETEDHERAEGFRFVSDGTGYGIGHDPDGTPVRRPFKPAHADGWNPGGVRTVVSETVCNTPNAGRLVQFPCGCGHAHSGRMGEHFTIVQVFSCPNSGAEGGCECNLGRV